MKSVLRLSQSNHCTYLKQSSQVNRSFINYILKLCSGVCASKRTMCAAQHRINSYSNERYGILAVPKCKLFGAFACSLKSLLAFRTTATLNVSVSFFHSTKSWIGTCCHMQWRTSPSLFSLVGSRCSLWSSRYLILRPSTTHNTAYPALNCSRKDRDGMHNIETLKLMKKRTENGRTFTGSRAYGWPPKWFLGSRACWTAGTFNAGLITCNGRL